MTVFSGSGGVRAMASGDYQATIYAGTAAGIQSAIDALATTGGEIHVGPGVYAFGSSVLSVPTVSIKIKGSGERSTQFTYSGSGDFITIGTDDGNHSGAANAYSGVASFLVIEDVRLTGPGIGTGRCIVDWENGNQVFNRINVDGWNVGFYGIGSDVNQFRDCYFLNCTTGVFLASRCDQNTFDACYFANCGIGANIEYANGCRFRDCQFVFSTTADIVYDSPASPTDGGDIRLDVFPSIQGCWFESSSGSALPRHIWLGRNGASGRVQLGASIHDNFILAANSDNFVEVDGHNVAEIVNNYQSGSNFNTSLIKVNSVSGVSQVVEAINNRITGSTVFGGAQAGAALSTFQRFQTATNSIAFSTSITPNMDGGGELVEIGPLTDNTTINAPTNGRRGMQRTFKFVQDGTGGRTVGWNAAFKHSWSDTGNTSNKISTISFYFNGTNWIQVGAQSPYF